MKITRNGKYVIINLEGESISKGVFVDASHISITGNYSSYQIHFRNNLWWRIKRAVQAIFGE
jgi:hypothetical protein